MGKLSIFGAILSIYGVLQSIMKLVKGLNQHILEELRVCKDFRSQNIVKHVPGTDYIFWLVCIRVLRIRWTVIPTAAFFGIFETKRMQIVGYLGSRT